MIRSNSSENVLGFVFMYTSWDGKIYLELRNYMAPRAGKPFILMITRGIRRDTVVLYKMSRSKVLNNEDN